MVKVKKRQNGLKFIKVNDIFDDLSEENKRLENELMFANNCLKVLNKFKEYLNKIYVKFETLIDSEDKQQLDHLEDEFNLVTKRKELITVSNVNITEDLTENIRQLSDNIVNENTNKIIAKNTTLLCESNGRRSGRTEPKLYYIPKPKRETNSKPKPVRQTIVIPDPEVEPNSLLLLRRNNFNEKTRMYVCPHPFCEKSLKTRKRLYHHFRDCHNISKKYICNLCDRGFKTRLSLKTHSIFHSDIRPFACDVTGCDLNFKTEYSLTSHKQSVHTKRRDYKCDECGKTYKVMTQLRTHKKIHSIKPSFKCRFDGCHQMFPTQHFLRKHQILCHNLKINRCTHSCDWPGCGFTTKRMDTFKGHKRLHTGEKPFICDWPGCEKRFRLKIYLTKHLLVHKDLKPFACIWPGCQYRCRTTENLKLHLKVHQK